MLKLRITFSLLTITTLLFTISWMSGQVKAAGSTTYQPTEKTTGLVKNPAMGWVLYCDAFGQMTNNSFPEMNKCVSNPSLFWETFDQSGATAKASIFYLRAPWSFYEPTEGNYGWENNGNFTALVEGAKNRGLKLAFRVYVDSQDSYQQATPQYVRDAGAKGYTNTFWTPYVNDQVFLNKLSAFISAFGEKYNDPTTVDFIDGMGLGAWGEGHDLRIDSTQPGTINSSVAVVTQSYRTAFPKILIGGQQGGSLASTAQSLAESDKFDILRRDSIGMAQYFTQADKNFYVKELLTFGIPLFAENGWNYFAHDFAGYMSRNGNPFSNIRDMLVYSLNDAKAARANTFDLRVPEDAVKWMENVDLVDDFIINGGYRLVPVQFIAPDAVTSNNYVTIESSWKNTGLGKLPNSRPAWNYKYKVAYALLNSTTKQPIITRVTNIDPSEWLKGSLYDYETALSFGNIANGTYDLAYAIVDTTRGNVPAINLAVTNPVNTNGWYSLGPINVSGIGSTAPMTDLPSYRFSEDFNNIQGAKQWYYMQGSGSTFTNMTWLSGTNQWKGAYDYNLIGVNGLIHPDTNDTVIAWKAPQAGNITIKGRVAKQNSSCGDGVKVKILKNSSPLWPNSGWQDIAATDTIGVNHELITTVAQDDYIYFVLNRNSTNACDGSRWNPVIEYRVPSVNIAPQATVTTTSGASIGQISNINNGIITDSWSSQNGITFPTYITLDLSTTAKRTNKITLVSHYGIGQGITNVDIEVKNNGQWTPVATQVPITWNSNTDEEEYRNITFSTVTTSQIRIKVNNGNLSWGHIALNEIQWWSF
ncbi:discoidin domain-containing protein [Paenibacillus sp. DMB5]|uniref:discoidin domain-containing protein n=1 Tax=Paenibacillus sp. DMB5 TaxID=1780103 RepID=UPI00076CFBC2|nr:discoidin domain-containing protein [Paenibacillus sp. DMB5]KUP22530.1 hypothetical protein AWJ19_31600 [Paenibacillus sp. DMB5]